ncbi:hypothetical protein DL546_003350 [Coniochaeta pulveracea]|uniref:Uncharacterized protein n=1 Tax=Coniochaeta pulveracea TaxID=177199 RepID=A0A420YEN9_9PEZI|nr:hypothetical protein DL546_003350 [Coniochaeta pulveracea]
MVYTSQLEAALVFLAVGAIGSVGAVPGPSDEHIAILLSRQAPGTPAYDCHYNCGTAITLGKDGAHCTNTTWQNLYQECLECALDFDIWKYYGGSLTGFASACGLSTIPSPSGDEPAAPSTTSNAATPPTTLETTTTVPPTTSSSATDGTTTTEALPTTSTAAPDTGLLTPTGAATTTQSTVPDISSTESSTTAPPIVGTGSTNSSWPTTTGNVVVTAGAAGSPLTPSLLGVTAMALLFLRGLW